MALTRRDAEEMAALVQRLLHGSVTREDWSNLLALTFLTQSEEALAAISAQGLDAFIVVAQPVCEGHAFHFDDFRRIYERICRAASPSLSRVVH